MLRLLRREEVLRIAFSVGGDRATTLLARRRVRGGRDSSKVAPKARNPSLASTRSRHLCGLAGASMELESAANGIGMTAHLAGLAATTTSTGVNLGAAHQSSPRKVRAERLRTRALT